MNTPFAQILMLTLSCALAAIAVRAQQPQTEPLEASVRDLQKSTIGLDDALDQVRRRIVAESPEVRSLVDSDKLEKLRGDLERALTGAWIIRNPDGTENAVDTKVRVVSGDRFVTLSRVTEHKEVPVSSEDTEPRLLTAASVSTGRMSDMNPVLRVTRDEAANICRVVAYLDPQSGSELKTRYIEEKTSATAVGADKIVTRSASTVLIHVVLDEPAVRSLQRTWHDFVLATRESVVDADGK